MQERIKHTESSSNKSDIAITINIFLKSIIKDLFSLGLNSEVVKSNID